MITEEQHCTRRCSEGLKLANMNVNNAVFKIFIKKQLCKYLMKKEIHSEQPEFLSWIKQSAGNVPHIF